MRFQVAAALLLGLVVGACGTTRSTGSEEDSSDAGGDVQQDGGTAAGDAGRVDGGQVIVPSDAGPAVDAGSMDSGLVVVPDAGVQDAGDQDAGSVDAGDLDAGAPITPPRIRIELTWAEKFGDMDLHYVGPGGTFFDDQGDLDWKHSQATYEGTTLVSPTPNIDYSPLDWGKNNKVQPDGQTRNDPIMDLDQFWGLGPETITHPLPFNGQYQVIASYYCSHGSIDQGNGYGLDYGQVTATVKILVDGVVAYTATQKLLERDVWTVATILLQGSVLTVAPATVSVWHTQNTDQYCQYAPMP